MTGPGTGMSRVVLFFTRTPRRVPLAVELVHPERRDRVASHPGEAQERKDRHIAGTFPPLKPSRG